MSIYSKRIYALMMKEINIMGPYQIDRVCASAGISPFQIAEKDLPYLAKELSRVVLTYGGQERARRFVADFRRLYDMDAIIEAETDLERKAEHLMDLGDLQRLMGAWSEARRYYFEVLELAKDNELGLCEGRAHRKLGWIYSSTSEFDKADEHLGLALALAQKTGDDREIAKTYRDMAYMKWRRGEFDEATSEIERALEIAAELDNKRLTAELMIRRATILNDRGMQSEAIRQLQESVDILGKMGDYLNLSKAYNNIGVIKKCQGDISDALDFFAHSLGVADKTESSRSRAYPLANGAECYIKLGDVSSAKKWASEARGIFESLGERFMLARLKVIDAFILDAQGERDESERSLKGGIEMLREISIPNDLAWELYEAGLLYKKWGRPESSEMFTEAEEIFRGLGNEKLAQKVRENQLL